MNQKLETEMKLTGKQRLAAEHYSVHGDKTAAYRHAYSHQRMKPATVHRNACRLFDTPTVAAYVQSLQNAATTAAVIERHEALCILADIARGKVSEFIREDGGIDTAAVSRSGYSLESFRRAVTEGGTTETIKVRDPISAIDRIAKLEGWDKQREDKGNNVSFTFIIDGKEVSTMASE